MPDKPNIAVIDDDASVRIALGNLLEALGYPVRTFESARDFIDSEGPDGTACLITDVQMPGMSGLDLMEHLSSRGVSIPTVIVSAHSQEGLRSRAMRQGAVDYLIKPVRHEMLIACINRAVA